MFSKNSVAGVVAGVSALAMGTALGEDNKVTLKGIVILDVDRTITCGIFAGDGDCKGPQKSSANVFRQAALGGSPSPFCRDGAYYFPNSGPNIKDQGVSYALRTGRNVQDFLNTHAQYEKGWLTAIASHSGDDLTVNQPGCNISKYDFVKNEALKDHTLGMGTDCIKIGDTLPTVTEKNANLCVHSPWTPNDPGATKDVMVKFLLKSLDTLMDTDSQFKAFEFGENFEVRFIDDEVDNHTAVLLNHDDKKTPQVYTFNNGKLVSSTCAFYPNYWTESYQGSPQCENPQSKKCSEAAKLDDGSTGIQAAYFQTTLMKMQNQSVYKNPDSTKTKEHKHRVDPIQPNCNPE